MVLVLKKGASKKEMDNISVKRQALNGVNTKNYGGTIKLKAYPLTIQKKWGMSGNKYLLDTKKGPLDFFDTY